MFKLVIAALMLVGCVEVVVPADAVPDSTPKPTITPTPTPISSKLDWSGRHKDSEKWTTHCLNTVKTTKLVKLVPNDYKEKYPATEEARAIFWCQLVSRMARYESNHRPTHTYTEAFNDSKGVPVISRGLLQISIESGKSYNSSLKKPEQLHDSETNITTGLLIIERWLDRDRVIFGGTKLGCGRYWSVCRASSDKQALIKSYLKTL